MAVSISSVIRRLPARRRRKIAKRSRELIAEELTLRDLRRARGQTQRAVAGKLKIGQEGISRIEQRSDLLLSTLSEYVAALGGTLEIVARFPNRKAVTLSGFGELEVSLPLGPRDKAAR
jgi:transcriptional regulator with XRE-family HTH domain